MKKNFLHTHGYVAEKKLVSFAKMYAFFKSKQFLSRKLRTPVAFFNTPVYTANFQEKQLNKLSQWLGM